MGTQTLAGMRTTIRAALDSATSASIPDTQTDEWINHGYQLVTQPVTYEHPELMQRFGFLLISGQDTYDITAVGLAAADDTPTASSNIYNGLSHATYVDTTTFPLDPGARRIDLEVVYGDQFMEDITITVPGEPRRVSTFDRTVRLDRQPSASEVGKVLSLMFWMEPVPLSGDSDVTVIPSVWDRIILAFATAEGFFDRGDFQRAQAFQQKAGLAIQGKTGFDQLRIRNMRNRSTVRSTNTMGQRGAGWAGGGRD